MVNDTIRLGSDRANLICPECGQLDHVRKLSSIASSDVRRTVGVHEAHDETIIVEETSQSALAKRLAAPRRPREPVSCLLNLLRGCLVPLLAVGLIGFLGMGFGWPFLVTLLVIAGGWWALLLGVDRLVGWWQAHYPSRAQRTYEEALAAWEGAMQQWQASAYCARCDRVFGQGE